MKLTLGNQEIEITEEQRQQLIDDLNSPEKADSWPQENDEYLYNDEVGDTLNELWTGDQNDRTRANIGNVFKSREEAQAHVRYLKALTRVKGSSAFRPKGAQQKFFVRYSHASEDLEWEASNWTQAIGIPVFYESRKAAEQAIKDHKEDFLILAGVK